MGNKAAKQRPAQYPAGFPGAAPTAAAGYPAGYGPAYPAGYGAGYPAGYGAGYPVAAAPVAPVAYPAAAYPAYPQVGGLYDGLAPPSYSAYTPAGSFGPAAVIPPTVLQQQQPIYAPVAAPVYAPVPVAAPVQYQTVSPAFFNTVGAAGPYAGNAGTFTVPPSPAFGGYPGAYGAPLTTLY